jgi:hypothetical protein
MQVSKILDRADIYQILGYPTYVTIWKMKIWGWSLCVRTKMEIRKSDYSIGLLQCMIGFMAIKKGIMIQF